MKHVDYVSKIQECFVKREEVLKRGQSISLYNKWYDKMIVCKQKIFEENRQSELVSQLYSESASIRYDVACILFHHYPELCTQVLREIADMTFENGMPKYLAIISTGARCTLEYGIPL